MLKKLLTGCLTIAAAAALTLPAMAADMSGKVGGRAVADLVSKSSKTVSTTTGKAGESVSYLDMASEGRLDYTLTATEGDWTVSGKFEIRSNSGDRYEDKPIVLQKYIKLENEAFSVALGTQAWGIVYLTPYVGDSGQWDRPGYGTLDYRADRLVVALKQVGLQLELKMDHAPAKTDITKSSSVTTENYDETQYGAQYVKAFGPLNLALQYMSRTWKANKNESPTTEKSAQDGQVWTEADLLVQYAISEAMFVEGDYGAATAKAGTSGAKTETISQMGLAFSMAMSEVQGFTVAYDINTYNSGQTGAKDVVKNTLTATFQQKIADQKLWVAYSSSTKDFGVSSYDKETSSTFALGGRVSF